MVPTTVKTRPIGLSDVPDDVLFKIIQLVSEYLPSEQKKIHKLKWKSVQKVNVAIADMDTADHWLYDNPTGNDVVLNSLQALASTNKRFHQICCPWLWKTLRFPTALPTVISSWTDGILPKHGHLVQSLQVALSTSWLTETSLAKTIEYYSLSNGKIPHCLFRPTNELSNESNDLLGNVISLPTSKLTRISRSFYSRRGRTLSYQVINDIISKCPNIKTLNLILPDNKPMDFGGNDYRQNESTTLTTNLIKTLSTIKNLRSLDLHGPIYAKDLVEILKQLYSLESFTCSEIRIRAKPVTEEDQEDDSDLDVSDDGEMAAFHSFASLMHSVVHGNDDSSSESQDRFLEETEAPVIAMELTNLRNLKRLRLKDVDPFNETWALYPASPNLTDLQLINCHFLWPLNSAEFLSTYAPNLTKLELSYSKSTADMTLCLQSLFGPIQPGQNEDQIGLFNLPNLTDLTIYYLKGNDIPGRFKECSNIQRITCFDLPMDRWDALADLVCSQTWPKLKYLELRVPHSSDNGWLDTTESEFRLRKFFDDVGGEFIMIPTFKCDQNYGLF